MLRIIIIKELLNNITGLRFVLALSISLAVFTVGGFVFVSRYDLELQEFYEETSRNLSGLNESSMNLSQLANHEQTIHRNPKITRLFCEGFERTLHNSFKLDVFALQIPDVTGATNFLLPQCVDIDWMFVITLILSFFAILLTFDTFSGERERGTLPLSLSNSIPRDLLITGKYIGAVLTLAIPLFFGMLLNLIIVNLSGFQFDSGQWQKIAAFVTVSLLYLSIFLFSGMLVSSRSFKSSTSIVISLFVWIALVVLIPATGKIISEKFIRVPSRTEVDRMIHEAQTEIWDNSERYGKNAGSWGSNLNADWINPPARARLYNALTDAINRINEDYINRIMEQVNLGRRMTKVSPAIIYQTLSEKIFGTGVPRLQSMHNQIKTYKNVLRNFLIEEDKKDPDSWHLLAWRHPIIFSQKPVDFNAIPKFQETDQSVGNALGSALWDITALILINIFLFTAVFVSFLRGDVRQS